ncbi:MAG: uracil-DNA glycosylase [Minisyncoccales bacterium]|jgi:uracil-DNA glycosylase family 4
MNKRDQMKKIKDAVLSFNGSSLAKERKKNGTFPVIGEGSHDAKVIFIGEAPGKNESLTGKPFCGSAGKILDELFESIEMKREDVYITNIVKDRPPNNRDLFPEEIEAYAPFLEEQLKIIEPKIIVTLGRFSSHFILEKFGEKDKIAPISMIRGRVFSTKDIKILPLFHPASVIYDRSKKELLINDFQTLKKIIND